MRTESSTPSASARLRAEVDRARRWVGGAGRSKRLMLFAIAAAGLIATAYLTIPLDREETLWLYDSRRFAPDEALAIQKALAAEKIAFKSDTSNRVGVTKSTWPAALDALGKHKVERPSLDEIDQDYINSGSLMEGPAERAERQRWHDERALKAIIEGYEGVRSAHVKIKRTPVGRGLRPTWNLSASVVLDTDRRPPHKTVQSIQSLLSTHVDDLRPDAVTISDQSGRFYLKAGDPTAASATEGLARGEELREALLENLAKDIQGIDVVVTVEPATPVEAAPVVRPAKIIPPPPAAPADEVLKPNTPIDPKPEPVAPPPEPAPAPAPPTSGSCKANAWVKVPRSYYLKVFRDNFPGRQPSSDDLGPYRQKTLELVESAWAVLVPTGERGRVFVSTSLDDLGQAGPFIVPAGSEASTRNWPPWASPVLLGSGVGLGVALVFGAGFGMMAARRPALRPSRESLRSGLSVDAPSGPVPGPSERVRDLVRRDPEAAAGVLQRWIGQGEGGPNG